MLAPPGIKPTGVIGENTTATLRAQLPFFFFFKLGQTIHVDEFLKYVPRDLKLEWREILKIYDKDIISMLAYTKNCKQTCKLPFGQYSVTIAMFGSSTHAPTKRTMFACSSCLIYD